MTPLWRYLTKSEGMTAKQLACAAGMSIKQARSDLADLETRSKVARERQPVGMPHLWWRTESRPLSDDDALFNMALAAVIHPEPAKVRDVMLVVARRARNPAIREIVSRCATSRDPHRIVWATLQTYDGEEIE